MLPSPLFRAGAVFGVLSGAFMALPDAVETVTGEIVLSSLFLGLSPALALPLLLALHLRQSRAVGGFGTAAFLVNLIGLGLFGGAGFALNIVLVHLDGALVADLTGGPAGLVLLGSALVFAVGSVLFGIAVVRSGRHPRGPAAGLRVSPVEGPGPLNRALAPLEGLDPAARAGYALTRVEALSREEAAALLGSAGAADPDGALDRADAVHAEPGSTVSRTPPEPEF
ncbi:hypothetical protein [Nocardiopsis sp. LOL_012]|uniref:hypothetical protein n=1 Tax=Nocardiopsis sp. LOL_012 TaxID=3345409 RepID=UPI003A8A9D87